MLLDNEAARDSCRNTPHPACVRVVCLLLVVESLIRFGVILLDRKANVDAAVQGSDTMMRSVSSIRPG